ncbi:transposase [Salinimicrobium sp. GXAS 041]|uniref:transposase n=1 Tax=Salinimicrobium sp. GXAS 041 TaxID=3400806 RepID=UPI003C76DE96
MKQDVLEPGVTYHIFNRGNNKEDIFKEEENYFYFLKLIRTHLLPVCDIYAYCLLKNHFHLLLKIKEREELFSAYHRKIHLPFSNFFNAYTKGINKKYNRTGSLFQENFKRKRVNDEKYLIQLIAYIHLNPVKHGFIEDHNDYKFSSFQAYTGTKPTNIKTGYVLSLINAESFQHWHNERRLNTEYLGDFLQDQT